MDIKKLPFKDITQFSKRDKAYHLNPELFLNFIEDIPSLKAIKAKIEKRNLYPIDREILVQHLNEQYDKVDTSNSVLKNISSLSNENTFTITTAHQPGLFCGPLYYVFKILSTVKLSEELNAKYPEHYFVPCFISGGEDHDFEEINHTSIFGKKLEWTTDQSGSCGRMSLDGIEKSIIDLKNILGDSTNAIELGTIIDDSYSSSKTYGEFTFRMVNQLFKDQGLVVFNMDSPILKSQFKALFKKELVDRFSDPLVTEQQTELNTLGYKSQATPREINVFYLSKQSRKRIILEKELYKVVDTDLSFTKDEILKELENHPERFSPNVILRPLYQEVVLPNLVYIGGGGEIAYWLERKKQFEAAKVSFPILIRRNSAGFIDRSRLKKWNALGFELNQMALDTDQLNKLFAMDKNQIPPSLADGKDKIADIFEQINKALKKIDPNLEKTAKAESQKIKKSMEILESKVVRHYKQKEEVNLNRIAKIQQFLFPNGGLQERKANFMEFYLKSGKNLFEEMKTHLNPLEKDFILFILD